jgi:hypothetical protein
MHPCQDFIVRNFSDMNEQTFMQYLNNVAPARTRNNKNSARSDVHAGQPHNTASPTGADEPEPPRGLPDNAFADLP